MTSTTVRTALEEFGDTLTMATTMGEALGMSPCVALETFFPAIVGDDDIMGALASMLEPAIVDVSAVVDMGAVSLEGGEAFIHNVFHLLQIAAALGHLIGVSEALAMADDVPADLSDVAWDTLPDVFGEESD